MSEIVSTERPAGSISRMSWSSSHPYRPGTVRKQIFPVLTRGGPTHPGGHGETKARGAQQEQRSRWTYSESYAKRAGQPQRLKEIAAARCRRSLGQVGARAPCLPLYTCYLPHGVCTPTQVSAYPTCPASHENARRAHAASRAFFPFPMEWLELRGFNRRALQGQPVMSSKRNRLPPAATRGTSRSPPPPAAHAGTTRRRSASRTRSAVAGRPPPPSAQRRRARF